MQSYIRTLAEGVALGPGWNLRVGASSSARARSAMTRTGFAQLRSDRLAIGSDRLRIGW